MFNNNNLITLLLTVFHSQSASNPSIQNKYSHMIGGIAFKFVPRTIIVPFKIVKKFQFLLRTDTATTTTIKNNEKNCIFV